LEHIPPGEILKFKYDKQEIDTLAVSVKPTNIRALAQYD